MLIYASRTGNVRFIVNQRLNVPSKELNFSNNTDIVDEEFILFTYTDGQGIVPPIVAKFMEINHKKCIGIICSGNVNFGEDYCKAGYILERTYNIPFLHKIDLRGVKTDYSKIQEIYDSKFSKEKVTL